MNDVVTIDRQPPVGGTPGLRLLEVAASRGASPEELEKWMALHERFEANEARKAHGRAMAKLKSELIVVKKTGHVHYAGKDGKPATDYDHETLWDVFEAAVPRMGQFGLSHTWELEQLDGCVKVICVLAHEDGHCTRTPLVGPRDESGGKNTIQSIGSTLRYLERYTLEAALGLAPKPNQEDDGRGSDPVQTITTDQQTEINDLIAERVRNVEKFLQWVGAASVGEIPANRYGYVKAELLRQAKKS